MTYHGIKFDAEKIAAFCRRHGIIRFSLFGSILRNDFSPESDVDVLVEFSPNAHVSLFDMGGMLIELNEMIGRQVDLKTPGFISEPILKRVLQQARVQYAA